MNDQTAATPAAQPESSTNLNLRFFLRTLKSISPRLKKWIRRNHRTLTLVGAFIVFTTFIVKDAVREQLRDLVDSERATEQAFQASVQRSDTLDAYYRIESKIDSVRARVFGQDKARDVPGTDEDKLRHMHRLLVQAKMLQPEIESLCKKLPQDGLVRLAREDTKKAIDKAEESYQEAVKALESLVADPQKARGVVPAIRKADNTAEYLVESLVGAVGLLTYDAQQARQNHELRLAICTWASYFLYSLGWGLGLAGRLVGVEGAGDGGA